MDPTEVVRRVLGVPSIITDANQERATAAILVRAAARNHPSLAREWTDGAIPERQLDASQAVVGAIVRSLGAGELDPILGDYAPAGETTQTYAKRSIRAVDVDVADTTLEALAVTLTDAIVARARSHPFDGS